MSLVKRRIGNRIYLYFKLPGPAEIYLGPEARPDHARVEEAMRYVRVRLRHYESLLHELEELTGIHEGRRRQPEIKELLRKLTAVEVDVLLKLSLTETGLSQYELERRGVPIAAIRPAIERFLELEIIERRAETKTKVGRRIVKYAANSKGAEIVLEHFLTRPPEEITEEKLRSIAEGNFDSTALGALYRQIKAIRVESAKS
jgi:predicted transcriptional regulator